MVFSSLEFLFLFFAATLVLYFAVPKKLIKLRNLILLAVSLIFYGWGEPKLVILMVITIILDYIFGFLVAKNLGGNKKAARGWLIASVIINLAILGFFKYYDFLAGSLNTVFELVHLGLKFPLLELELPIGISFYTFQALSYVIDVYRTDAPVQRDPIAFGAYVTLFPQLIAGPIVRYRDVDDMLTEREENITLFSSGIRTFACGMGKKVLLANVAGELWNGFSSVPTDERTVLGCWIGMICYMFQIYFDFSAYSDMAIGLGKMFGFRFLENFNYPYISKSITDFWRRWHMSLSTWFREYVYFPLGGSRVDKKWKIYRNIFVVWFLTGLWHGASWNFILWGLYYFVLLVIEKSFLLKRLERAPGFVQHIYTLFFVLFGWLLFVFEDMSAGTVYLGNMFGFGVRGFATTGDIYDLLRNGIFFIIMIIACTPYPKALFYRLYEKKALVRVLAGVGSIALIVLGTAYLVDSSFNPFLYFRF